MRLRTTAPPSFLGHGEADARRQGRRGPGRRGAALARSEKASMRARWPRPARRKSARRLRRLISGVWASSPRRGADEGVRLVHVVPSARPIGLAGRARGIRRKDACGRAPGARSEPCGRPPSPCARENHGGACERACSVDRSASLSNLQKALSPQRRPVEPAQPDEPTPDLAWAPWRASREPGQNEIRPGCPQRARLIGAQRRRSQFAIEVLHRLGRLRLGRIPARRRSRPRRRTTISRVRPFRASRGRI